MCADMVLSASRGLSVRFFSASFPQARNSVTGSEVLGPLPVCFTVDGLKVRFYLNSYRQING